MHLAEDLVEGYVAASDADTSVSKGEIIHHHSFIQLSLVS
jgi:hypothetical protein